MKNWLTSQRESLTLAAIAFLSFEGYTFLAALGPGKWNHGAGTAAIGTVVVVFLMGVWLWVLLSIPRGSRGMSIAVLMLSLLNILASARWDNVPTRNRS